MSYMGPSGAAMAGLYDVGQNKSIPPEQFIYYPGQLHRGIPLPPQYLPQSVAQQLPMQQGQVSLV